MLPKDLVNAFLTVFIPKKVAIKNTTMPNKFSFDFTKQNFIFATTELDKLFAHSNRLTIIDLQAISVKELAEITALVCGEIEFECLARHARLQGQCKVSS